MSVRFEWMADPVIHAFEAGTLIGEHEASTDALAIVGDEVTVVEGDLDSFAAAVTASVARLGWPVARRSALDVPLTVDELAEVAPDLDPGLRDTEDGEPWTARRIIARLLAFHDDDLALIAENEPTAAPLAALRHHVTGKIESGEAEPIEAVEVADHPFQGTDGVPGYCTRCGCAPFIHPLVHKMSGDLVPLCGAESGECVINSLSVTCEGCLAIVRAATR